MVARKDKVCASSNESEGIIAPTFAVGQTEGREVVVTVDLLLTREVAPTADRAAGPA